MTINDFMEYVYERYYQRVKVVDAMTGDVLYSDLYFSIPLEFKFAHFECVDIEIPRTLAFYITNTYVVEPEKIKEE